MPDSRDCPQGCPGTFESPGELLKHIHDAHGADVFEKMDGEPATCAS